ncbi:MAG: molybdopterin-dependent oxidoreductase, partial [Methylococcales bacterium]|nr:molybdopterin-dependent oxidoreductase [Methylococcales bacterium]
MKLIKRPSKTSTSASPRINRRTFLQHSGLTVGGAAIASAFPLTLMETAQATTTAVATKSSEIKKIRSVCTHCSVGCGVIAEVQNGIWIGQEPAFDHPFNLGAHCAKGASVREHGHGDRRLKYPMKMVNGEWRKVSWETAIEEIGDQILSIREQSGPDSTYWLGSSKHNNEQAYLFRKFAAFWGSNNIDHQARICHSTTVAGVANTWGYGAMTNSFNDIHNAKAILIIGGNPAEAHPISMQHIFRAKERGAPLIVIDPRFTRTAAHANQHIKLRPGTDVPLIWGILWHIFENKWEDNSFIEQRVYGMDEIRKEVAQWNPKQTEEVTGGIILRDSSNIPSGIFIDNALALIENHIPQKSKSDIHRQILKAQKLLNKFGITSIHDAGTSKQEIEVLKKMLKNDELSIRVFTMINNDPKEYDSFLKTGPEKDNPFIKIQ